MAARSLIVVRVARTISCIDVVNGNPLHLCMFQALALGAVAGLTLPNDLKPAAPVVRATIACLPARVPRDIALA